MRTKTLQEILETKTIQEITANLLDEATTSELRDYFYFRNVCDDDRFEFYLQRNIRIYQKQYNAYLRIESIDFDPFVTRYLEKQIKTSGIDGENGTDNTTITKNGRKDTQLTGSESSQTSNTTEVDNTETRNLATSDNLQTSGTETSNGGSGASSYAKMINAQFAQANMGNLSIDPEVVDVNYATSSQNNSSRTTGTTNNTTQTSGTNTGSGTQTGTIVDDGTSVSTGNASGTRQETVATTDTGTETKAKTLDLEKTHEGEETTRLTGRENYTAAELLSSARDYIKQTNAFLWLVNKLEICFIGNLRMED